MERRMERGEGRKKGNGLYTILVETKKDINGIEYDKNGNILFKVVNGEIK